jgi:hypothetical protein
VNGDAPFVPVSASQRSLQGNDTDDRRSVAKEFNPSPVRPSKAPPCQGCYRHGSERNQTPSTTSRMVEWSDLLISAEERLPASQSTKLLPPLNLVYEFDPVVSIDHPPR